jgi:ketosteroid isomerase-like protein
MEEHPNSLVAYGLWSGIAEGDVDALAEVISRSAVWRMPGTSPLAGEYRGFEEILDFMARAGELSDQLESDLLDVYSSDAGAILHYSIRALRGDLVLETEHLFRVRIKDGLIVEGAFAPIDQKLYDQFWRAEPLVGPEVQPDLVSSKPPLHASLAEEAESRFR